MSDDAKILVTTMGGQAQVVTFALDWFLAQGEVIGEVLVLHLSPGDLRVSQALAQLAVEFPNDCYAYTGQPLRFRHQSVTDERGPLRDIRDEAAAEATWQTVYGAIAELKRGGRVLHLCVAGGRRIMGLMAASAAMMHFGHQDRLWHLYTPDELRRRAFEGAVMHAGPDDGVRLIQVPVVPLGMYLPGLPALALAKAGETGGLASERASQRASEREVGRRVQVMDEAERQCCRAVCERLTGRQRQVLALFARGLSPQEAGERLHVSLNTLNTHKTAILAECRNVWALDSDHKLDYHFLHTKFGLYFGYDSV